MMSQNCCSPVETSQNKDVSLKIENCCIPTLAGNGGKQTNHCPACGQKGKKVDSITLKAMLKVSLLALRDVPYLFCHTAACPVVYFSADGFQTFTKDQIRVPVHQKEPDNELTPVCYCFRHTPATIHAELLATGTSTVIAEIEGGIKAGQCACEIRNPQGSCCLGNIQTVLKRVLEELSEPV